MRRREPTTRWGIFKLKWERWAVLFVLRVILAVVSFFIALGRIMPTDLKNEVLIPMGLVIIFIISFYMANDCSFTLPHFVT